MHDTLEQVPPIAPVDALALACDVAPVKARAVLRALEPRLEWALETRCLNRGGLADIVELVGEVDEVRYLGGGGSLSSPLAQDHGRRILSVLVGDAQEMSELALALAREAEASAASVSSLLPGLAVVKVATIAERVRPTLGAFLERMPSLGAWSKGSPHADLADILRRGCGAGPHGPAQLPRAVRRLLARAGGFGSLGVGGWYVRYMLLRPAARMARPLASRVLSVA